MNESEHNEQEIEEPMVSLHFIYCDCERCLTQRVFEDAEKK